MTMTPGEMPARTPDWDIFLRALLDTIDAHMAPEERAVLLRAIGVQMASLSPIGAQETLAGLQARINERLAGPRWGQVSITLDSDGPSLILTHEAPPELNRGRDGGDEWVAAVLEGLHAGWMSAQPGAEPDVPARVVSAGSEKLVLRYGA